MFVWYWLAFSVQLCLIVVVSTHLRVSFVYGGRSTNLRVSFVHGGISTNLRVSFVHGGISTNLRVSVQPRDSVDDVMVLE